MKIWVHSHYEKKFIENALKEKGIVLSRKPDFVITYGGDGTILETERFYPGVPKIPIKKSIICSQCMHYSSANIHKIIAKLKMGSYRLRTFEKIEAAAKGKTVTAMNEIVIRNKLPYKAIRFSVLAGRAKKENIIGDGIVAATAHGSTAYYKNIGYKPFKSGARIGFNNANIKLPFIPLRKKAVVKILREDACVAADNNPEMIEVKKSDAVTITISRKKARFVEIN